MSAGQSKFLIVAYPELAENDFEKIENFRKQYDQQFKLIRPHFTLVFPIDGFDVKELIAGIQKQVNRMERIPFITQQAIVHKDSFDDQYRVFLVPTEGHHRISQLHEKLYSGRLKDHLMGDVIYVPHITIGNSHYKNHMQEITDDWNSRVIPMHGTITSIDIIQYEKETLTTIENIRLM